MEFMGTKEAGEKWGFDKSTISRWCREGRIDGAEQDAKGSPWRIPVNSPCPGKTIN
ncbi:MAG: helix-turn-helix domain-containing protein [Clostridia bacterium]|nr:helix-turn-helix domain-containing protein [Clostridia bacterium]